MAEVKDLQEFDSSLIVISVFNTFLSYTAIMLNILTILALRNTSSLPKPVKTLVLSLAVSDLGVGLLVQPLNVARLVVRLKGNTTNNSTYKITENVFYVTGTFLCYASVLGVTAITADRFFAVHLHLRYQELVTHKRVVAVVTSIWVLSAIFSPLWLWDRQTFFAVTGIILTVCLILTAYFYCKIYLAVTRHTNEIQLLRVEQVGQNEEMMANTARQIKCAVFTFYVYLVFLFCYSPFISVNVVKTITGPSTLIDTLWDYSVTLTFLNSSLNPVVYCWKMEPIRNAIMNMLRNMFSSETTL